MTVLVEGNLRFTFPLEVAAVKYDEWPPYRQWRDLGQRRTGVDAVASDGRATWFLEVKDFRVQDAAPKRSNSSGLPKTVYGKVRSTIAGLTAMADDGNSFAMTAMAPTRRRIVLHLEPPIHGQRLFPSKVQVGNIHEKLRKLVRKIDPEPLVVQIRSTPQAGVPWTVG